MNAVFRTIAGWLRSNEEPKLQAAYHVFHRGLAIASLDDPVIEDQFWVSFRLTALSASPELVAVLYDDDSWLKKSFVIRERESMKAILFLLAPGWEETEDDVIVRNVLKAKPERVLLRGPYRYETF